jgi:hypothetical protein
MGRGVGKLIRKECMMRHILGFLLVLLGSSGYDSVMAQSTGSFTATGNMITPRAGHTATLLTNGKVLIAGGSPSVPASAELYDPVPGTFSATGNMTQGRVNHTATLLPDGKVLIVGGCANLTSLDFILPALSSAELYDPVMGNFTPTGSMTTLRAAGFTATLLPNGKVLIVGGTLDPSRGSFVTTDAELYDPLTGNFARTGELNVRREGHTATLLANGKVLIAGGVDSGDEPIAAAELYDPETGAFTPTGGIGSLDSVQRATLLPDGTVFALAHVENVGSLGDSAVRYDPSTGSFSAAGNRPTLFLPATTLLSDGTVLLTAPAPGVPYSPVANHTADLYDPVKRTFSTVGDLNTPRGWHTATLLSAGAVLITGGSFSFPPVFLASAEIYHPAVSKPAPVLYSQSGDGQGAILHGGTARLASSSDPASAGESLEIYLTGLADGSVIPPQVVIGGRIAELLFFGKAPGFAGLNQVNVQVPSGVAPGPAVPVGLNYLGRPSNEVTIGVR